MKPSELGREGLALSAWTRHPQVGLSSVRDFLVHHLLRNDPGDFAPCAECGVGHQRHQPDTRASVDDPQLAGRELLTKGPCRSGVIRPGPGSSR